MCPTIEVSKSVLNRIQELAGPLFSQSDVIERLLDQMSDSESVSDSENGQGTSSTRVPRSRGAELEIDGHRITAVSVRDMYELVLQWLVAGGNMSRLSSHVPFRTSNQRFLIAKEPKHPNGNPFVAPVSYKEYYMEAHKNYENAMSGLQQFCKLAGITVRYVS